MAPQKDVSNANDTTKLECVVHGDAGTSACAEVTFRCTYADSIEPVAVISPLEASQISQQRWATFIEFFAKKHAAEDSRAAAAVSREFVVLEFGRDPPAFRNALLNSGLAQQMISLGLDIQPSWANGATFLLEACRCVCRGPGGSDGGPLCVTFKDTSPFEAQSCNAPQRFRIW